MVVNFRYSESTVKPSAIEMCKKSVFIRQNITEKIRIEESGNSVTYWAYEEASLTPEEFNEYIQYIPRFTTFWYISGRQQNLSIVASIQVDTEIYGLDHLQLIIFSQFHIHCLEIFSKDKENHYLYPHKALKLSS